MTNKPDNSSELDYTAEGILRKEEWKLGEPASKFFIIGSCDSFFKLPGKSRIHEYVPRVKTDIPVELSELNVELRKVPLGSRVIFKEMAYKSMGARKKKVHSHYHYFEVLGPPQKSSKQKPTKRR